MVSQNFVLKRKKKVKKIDVGRVKITKCITWSAFINAERKWNNSQGQKQ